MKIASIMNQTKLKISVMMFFYGLASVIALVPGHFLMQSNFEVLSNFQ